LKQEKERKIFSKKKGFANSSKCIQDFCSKFFFSLLWNLLTAFNITIFIFSNYKINSLHILILMMPRIFLQSWTSRRLNKSLKKFERQNWPLLAQRKWKPLQKRPFPQLKAANRIICYWSKQKVRDFLWNSSNKSLLSLLRSSQRGQKGNKRDLLKELEKEVLIINLFKKIFLLISNSLFSELRILREFKGSRLDLCIFAGALLDIEWGNEN